MFHSESARKVTTTVKHNVSKAEYNRIKQLFRESNTINTDYSDLEAQRYNLEQSKRGSQCNLGKTSLSPMKPLN